MDYRYYNQDRINRLIKLSKNSPYLAISEFQEYLKDYPLDYVTHIRFTTMLLDLGFDKEAEKLINTTDFDSLIFNKFSKHASEKNVADNMNVYLVNKFRILCHNEQYEEAYEFCCDNYIALGEYITILHVYRYFLMLKLGFVESDSCPYEGYMCQQIYDYSYEKFLDHISKHLADNNMDVEEPNGAVFVPDFPLEEVLEEVKNYIPSDKNLSEGFITNQYVFKYDLCGKVDYKYVDYFKVVTFIDSQDFITMFPFYNKEGFEAIDLNYMQHKKEWFVKKRTSQIEKFNEKYNTNS